MCPTCVKVLAWIAPHQSLLGGEKLWVQGYSIDSRVVRHRFTLFLRIKDQSCRIHLSSSCLQIYLSSLTVVPTSIEHDHSTQAAKRIVGAQGKYEKWGPCYRLYKGGPGARPQKILRFYMLWSAFWRLQRFLFARIQYTVHIYQPVAVFV